MTIDIDQIMTNTKNPENHGIAAYLPEQTKKTQAAGFFGKSSEAVTVSSAGNVQMEAPTYGKPESETKTAAQQLEGAMEKSPNQHKNQMVILSQTLSPEDYKELEKEGFSFRETDSHTIITVTDKIKAVLAKAGVDVSAYGDTMDEDELQEITGSVVQARQIAQKLKESDLPDRETQIQEIAQAYNKASSIVPLDEDTIAYMIRNEKAPTIDNLYKAQYSSDRMGMVSFQDADLRYQDMEEQIAQIIDRSGMEVNDETIQQGKWMIANNLPFTAENLAYYNALTGLSEQLIQLPEDESAGWILDAEVTAVAEGKEPGQAYLISGYSLLEQAKDAKRIIDEANDSDLYFCEQNNLPLTIENLAYAKEKVTTAQSKENTTIAETSGDVASITARRQLEETRLMMTTQANYALLKKGISINTQNLEQLVDELKAQEMEYYTKLLGESPIENVNGKAQMIAESSNMIESLKMRPAYVLSMDNIQSPTIRSLDAAGSALQRLMQNAGEAYETLWTSPRADLGDSIQKAFQNVDAILEELGMNKTQANERAVRILAYNQTEITVENIHMIRNADETVQRTFANMTPAVTLEMIRRDQNPLDMGLEELNLAAEQIKSDLGYDDNERFSKYLWKLEKKHEISEKERTSYIGIYRLMNQVDETDGAVIGALIGQGADLSMRNLLSAVRTYRKGDLDYAVDDDFEGVKVKSKGITIDMQIEAAYQRNCVKDVMETLSPVTLASKELEGWEDMTPDQMKEALARAAQMPEEKQADAQYSKEMLAQYDEVLNTPEQIYELLEQYEIPATMSNILAYERMTMDQNGMFQKLFANTKDNQKEEIRSLRDQVLENFADALENPKELADAQETLAKTAENVMKTMTVENDNISSVDLKELRLLNKQFALCAKKAKQESYMIPMQTGDSVTGVSLKIVRGTDEQGYVDILFRGELMGKVAASFHAKENGISGMIATDDKNTRALIADHIGMFAEAVNEDGDEPLDVSVAYVDQVDFMNYEKVTGEGEETSPVQTKRLYHIAEAFLKTMQELISDEPL